MSGHVHLTARYTPGVLSAVPLRHTGYWRPREAIRRIYEAAGTWQSVAALLGYTPAYWRMVATGERKISRQADNALRWLWRLPPKYTRRVERMSESDLARYIRERREVR